MKIFCILSPDSLFSACFLISPKAQTIIADAIFDYSKAIPIKKAGDIPPALYFFPSLILSRSAVDNYFFNFFYNSNPLGVR